MAKSKKRTATRNKSSSKSRKASITSVKRSPKMAAKRARSKRTKSRPRRIIQTAIEPVIQSRDSAAPVEAAETVVVEPVTVMPVERPAPDTVVAEHGSVQSAPSGGGLEQGQPSP